MPHSEHFIIHTHLLLQRISNTSMKPEDPDLKRALHFEQNATSFLLYTS